MKKTGLVIVPGMKVGVLGLGVSGLAGVKFLLSKGAEVLVSDRGPSARIDQDELMTLKECGVEFEFEGHTAAFFSQAQCVVAGPGVPLESEIVKSIRKLDIPVVGELAVVCRDIEAPIIAITGTNGKTTVTDLIDTILQENSKTTFAGGNIGTPVYNYCTEQREADVLVLEVSSFQLDLAGSFAPKIGILLNVTPDHIDRHGSLDNYAASKMKLFTYQGADDCAIINYDDPVCREACTELSVQNVKTFGHAAVCDAVIDDNHVITVGEEKYSLQNTRLNSLSGTLNGAAAILAAKQLGCEQEKIQRGLEKYQPLSHRMEFVREIAGVTYYNDSKATNTGAVINALSSFQNKSVLLIAGGSEKGEDYTVLREIVKKKVKQLILIGETAESIGKAVTGCAPVFCAKSLDEALEMAKNMSQAGDVVLLSPACASFDMFDSYVHRGEMFIQKVNQLTG